MAKWLIRVQAALNMFYSILSYPNASDPIQKIITLIKS